MEPYTHRRGVDGPFPCSDLLATAHSLKARAPEWGGTPQRSHSTQADRAFSLHRGAPTGSACWTRERLQLSKHSTMPIRLELEKEARRTRSRSQPMVGGSSSPKPTTTR